MTLEGLFVDLYGFKGMEYAIYQRGLPGLVRQHLVKLCDDFRSENIDLKKQILERIRPEISYLFLRFSAEMAEEAVQLCNAKCIVDGLTSLAMEIGFGDWRDSTIVLALLYNSALKIGADPTHLFRNAESVALQQSGRELFSSFLARSPDKKELAAFGLKEAVKADGRFTYVGVA